MASERIRRRTLIVVSKYRGAARKSSGRGSTEYASDVTAPERGHSSELTGQRSPQFVRSVPALVTA